MPTHVPLPSATVEDVPVTKIKRAMRFASNGPDAGCREGQALLRRDPSVLRRIAGRSRRSAVLGGDGVGIETDSGVGMRNGAHDRGAGAAWGGDGGRSAGGD